jgi:hypothetical protein
MVGTVAIPPPTQIHNAPGVQEMSINPIRKAVVLAGTGILAGTGVLALAGPAQARPLSYDYYPGAASTDCLPTVAGQLSLSPASGVPGGPAGSAVTGVAVVAVGSVGQDLTIDWTVRSFCPVTVTLVGPGFDPAQPQPLTGTRTVVPDAAGSSLWSLRITDDATRQSAELDSLSLGLQP